MPLRARRDTMTAARGVDDAKLIELPRVGSTRGNLTFLESKRHVPFEIQRVFFLYDVPGGESRAGHANRTLEELLIAVSGSFDVTVDDGKEHRTFFLNRSYYGLYIPSMLWREITNFSSGSVCLVLASDYYDANDYHRSYNDYRVAMAEPSTAVIHASTEP
jgi:dTDP-4-dehydrorhamnose 3,5-epimerase-like enzyme